MRFCTLKKYIWVNWVSLEVINMFNEPMNLFCICSLQLIYAKHPRPSRRYPLTACYLSEMDERPNYHGWWIHILYFSFFVRNKLRCRHPSFSTLLRQVRGDLILSFVAYFGTDAAWHRNVPILRVCILAVSKKEMHTCLGFVIVKGSKNYILWHPWII
jgi:hypothetical protein